MLGAVSGRGSLIPRPHGRRIKSSSSPICDQGTRLTVGGESLELAGCCVYIGRYRVMCFGRVGGAEEEEEGGRKRGVILWKGIFLLLFLSSILVDWELQRRNLCLCRG